MRYNRWFTYNDYTSIINRVNDFVSDKNRLATKLLPWIDPSNNKTSDRVFDIIECVYSGGYIDSSGNSSKGVFWVLNSE